MGQNPIMEVSGLADISLVADAPAEIALYYVQTLK